MIARLLLIIVLAWPVSAQAVPSISGTSGTVTHGQTITITGTDFGAKGGTNANKPLIWADFESSINPTSLGHLTAWDGNNNLVRATGGTQYGLSGANVVGTRSTGVRAFDFQVVRNLNTFYLAGKRRFTSVASTNFKFFRVWNDASSSMLAASIADGMAYDESNTTQDNRWQPHGLTANAWRMEEYHFKRSTSNNASPVSGNGTYRYAVNGTVFQDHTNYLATHLTANYGQYLGLSVFDNFDTNDELPNGTQIFMDDFYLDDTWAHVVIGNASTLSASTIREVQIPSAWSNTSISVTVNRGSFGAAATVYLYVIDANNVASAGQAITFGSGSSNPMPTAGSKANDPTYGTEMIRLTDSGDSATDCFTGYSNISSFNRGNSRVAAVCNVSPKRWKVWDWNQSTNTRSNPRIQSNPPSGYREGLARWSHKWNNKTFACANRVLYEVTIPDGTSTTWTNTIVRDFSAEIGGTATDYCESVSLSLDDDVFAMHFVVAGVNAGYLVYKRSTNAVLLNVNNQGTIDEVEIDKTGQYLVARTAAGGVSVWSSLTTTPVQTQVTTEPFVHRAMGSGIVVSACSGSTLCKRNLSTPNTVTTILASGWSYATQQDHLSMVGESDAAVLSCRYHTNAGSATNPYDNECVQVATDGSGVTRRLLHHAAVYSNDYDAQPKAAFSQDGRYITWTSNWDGADVSTPNHVYIADLSPSVCNGTSPNLAPPNVHFKNAHKCIEVATDGDTVTFPAGSASWEGTLVWTNKSITLKGAGIGLTNIRGNVMGAYPCLMNITLKPTGNTPAGLTRVTGFTFQPPLMCGDNTPNTPDGMIGVKGDSPNWRFDHNRVESGEFSGGLTYTEYVRGVVDHNEWLNLAPTFNRKSSVCWHTKWDTATLDYGGSSWAKPSTIGAANQLIFEDNLFDRSIGGVGFLAATDDYAGCRSTYRFNSFVGAHLAVHGTETGQYIRGFREAEIYRNTYVSHLTGEDSVVKFRDGTGMIFDNATLTSWAPRFGAFTTLRRQDDGSHVSGTWFPWKACGDHGTVVSITRSGSTATVTMSQRPYVPAQGAWIKVEGATQPEYNGTFFATGLTPDTNFQFTYPVSGTPATPATGTITVRAPFDGNTDATGYPCLDQIGRGQGVLFVGTGSNMTPTTAANQISQPVYCFNNTIAGTLFGCEATYGTDVILENRDFYNQQTSFTGAAGVGRGLRAARPSTCTAGTAYWSTNGGGDWNALGEDGALDKCTATNTWTDDWYVPPAYPHPLNVAEVDGGGLGWWIPQGSRPMAPMIYLRR